MHELIFHPDVGNEIKTAYTWYQKQAAGLGEDFLAELESAYNSRTSRYLAEIPKRFSQVFA